MVQVGCSSTDVADIAVPTLHMLPEWLWSHKQPDNSQATQCIEPVLEARRKEEVLVVT